MTRSWESPDRASALFAEVALDAYEPGPLQVELTSDRRVAVVSISPGFYDGVVGAFVNADQVPLGGTLLLVDLETQSVAAEVTTAHVPMGIAISS